MIIGKKLRELREQKGLLLRQVAAELEVDTAYISKMEQGKKNIKRDFILKLAGIYNYDESELITLWLADHISEIVKNEVTAVAALNIVLKNLK
jgi:HTH-type transcriptional regulator, competence development regulator